MNNLAVGTRIIEEPGQSWVKWTKDDGKFGVRLKEQSAFLTLDFEAEVDLKVLRFFLGIYEQETGSNLSEKRYYLRVSGSKDQDIWHVYYDSLAKSQLGWTELEFSEVVQLRYLKIFILTVEVPQEEEEIVTELEFYSERSDDTIFESHVSKLIPIGGIQEEVGDGLPVSSKIKSSVENLELIKEKTIIGKEWIDSIIDLLSLQVKDIEAIEMSLLSVRREIIGPVKRELEEAGRAGKFSIWGFWVGIIGGALAIISIVFGLIPGEKESNSLDMTEVRTLLGYDSQSTPSSGQIFDNDTNHVKLLVYAWDRAMGLHDIDLLSDVYGSQVNIDNRNLDIIEDQISFQRYSILLEKKFREFRYFQHYDYQSDYLKNYNFSIRGIDLGSADGFEVTLPIVVPIASTNGPQKVTLKLKKNNHTWKIVDEAWDLTGWLVE